jgi:hypothetical protein
MVGMDDLMSTAEAAEALDVEPRSVVRYHQQGLLPGRMLGDRLFFLREDVEKFVKPTMGRPRKGVDKASKVSKTKKKGK